MSLSPSVVLCTTLVTSLALSWLRPFRNEDLCGLRRSQSSLSVLACCWLCSCTSCRSALLSLAVGPFFPFFSVSTTSAATSLTSTCLSTCSSSFHNCFARQLSVRNVSCNATLLSRALPLLHGCEPSVSTSCSLVHVLTHVFSARSFTCGAWFGGLPAPLYPSSARCACRGSSSPELGLVRQACVAIHLRSALAEGLSVDAIVFRVHFRSASRLQSRRT